MEKVARSRESSKYLELAIQCGLTYVTNGAVPFFTILFAVVKKLALENRRCAYYH